MDNRAYERGKTYVTIIVALSIISSVMDIMGNRTIFGFVVSLMSILLSIMLYRGNSLVIIFNKILLLFSVINIFLVSTFTLGFAFFANIVSFSYTLFKFYCLFINKDVEYFFAIQRDRY